MVSAREIFGCCERKKEGKGYRSTIRGVVVGIICCIILTSSPLHFASTIA